MQKIIEVTVVSDSTDSLSTPRKALLRVDQITSVVDVSSAGYINDAVTSIVTEEPDDFVNEDDETGGVVRASRKLVIQESYTRIQMLINSAGQKS